MKNTPVPVLKFRMKASERTLSRELGYKVSFPEKISLKEYSAEYSTLMKTIEEYSNNGVLVRKLSVYYELKTPVSSADLPAQLELYILPPGTAPDTDDSKDCTIISTDTVSLGTPVTRTRCWALSAKNMTDKPEVCSSTEWSWRTADAGYSLSANSSKEAVCEAFIRNIVAK